MFTENGVLIDLDEVRKVVDNCDVFTIGFRLFPQRLIVDTRFTGEEGEPTEGPMLELVEPVATVEERFFWLGKRRPNFGVPERFTFFVWPHSVRFLEESALMDRVRERLYPIDSEKGRAVAETTIKLHILERRAVLDAITGKQYHTLWAAAPA
ncbi:MAG: hypothetical protein E6J42_04500 [Chloroflexi bacterium]|nr:MAG: hypothetical protein E6J42_04500 [Chloroflexota bacterium]